LYLLLLPATALLKQTTRRQWPVALLFIAGIRPTRFFLLAEEEPEGF
jgi:hypothetical protein